MRRNYLYEVKQEPIEEKLDWMAGMLVFSLASLSLLGWCAVFYFVCRLIWH